MHVTAFEVKRTNRGIAVNLNLTHGWCFLDAIPASELANNIDAEIAAIQEGENAIWFTLLGDAWPGEGYHTIAVEDARELSRRLRKVLEEWAVEQGGQRRIER